VLAALERKLEGEPFLVVGVHSPKFPNERDEAQVREAVRRYGVTHPVVVDPGRRIWDEWGVNAWPTLVVVNADGEVVAAGSGEPDVDALEGAVRELLELGRREGTLAAANGLPLSPEPAPPGSLAYPGKVIAAGDRIYVADTGHDAVVECDRDGNELRRFASGLHHPNGLALVDGDLYVADTGNHALRRIEVATGNVAIVAGTGERGTGRGDWGPALETPLRSPWDLVWDAEDELLYVAMAGSHQIWAWDPATGEVGPFAGTGHELRRDGPAAQAAFAQPSGVTLLGGSLYVADSEISSVRAIDDLRSFPRARTVCGSGELFGFGDRDGVGAEVLLQHPIGIAAGDGVLYIADSFNHKVKRVDPATGECRTLFGNGSPERLPELFPGAPLPAASPDAPAFFEPEGLAFDGERLLVADTNNHRVLAVDLATGERRALVGR
jgi:DNA-binding beta-propeller fold protein YncE